MPDTSPETTQDAILPPLRHSLRGRVLAACALIFGCGVVMGVVGSQTAHWHSDPGPPGSPRDMTERIVQRLSGELKLNEEQEVRVREIFLDNATRIEEIQREVAPKMEAVMDDVERAMAGILNASQQEEWNEVRNRMRMMRPWREPGPGPKSSDEASEAGEAMPQPAGAVRER